MLSLLLSLDQFYTLFCVSVADFEQVNTVSYLIYFANNNFLAFTLVI